VVIARDGEFLHSEGVALYIDAEVFVCDDTHGVATPGGSIRAIVGGSGSHGCSLLNSSRGEKRPAWGMDTGRGADEADASAAARRTAWVAKGAEHDKRARGARWRLRCSSAA
jgi:hypothetical protein